MPDSPIVQDFARFAPRDYLREYYSSVGRENAFLLDFLHEIHSARPRVRRMLEVGGGPTVYQLISAAPGAEEIVFAEYLPANREELRLWQADDPAAFDWDPFFVYVLRREGSGGAAALARRKDEVRHKIVRIVPYDAKEREPLGNEGGPFDLVAVNFCLESITADEAEYRFSWERMSTLLEPGGLLVMTALKNARYYRVGALNFPAFPVDEESLFRYLNELPFEAIHIRSMGAEPGQGYPGIIALTARKRAGA